MKKRQWESKTKLKSVKLVVIQIFILVGFLTQIPVALFAKDNLSLNTEYLSLFDIALHEGLESHQYKQKRSSIENQLIEQNSINKSFSLPESKNSWYSSLGDGSPWHYSCYPIHLATFLTDKKHLSFLISNGARIDATDSKGRPPLLIAITGSQTALIDNNNAQLNAFLTVLKTLIQNKANLRFMIKGAPILNALIRPELMSAALELLSREDKEYLLSIAYANARANKGKSKEQTRNLCIQSAKTLLLDGSKGTEKVLVGEYPIHAAVMLGLKEHVQLLIQNEGENLELEDQTKSSPLMLALYTAFENQSDPQLQKENLDIALYLVQEGADINVRPPELGISPLEFASQYLPSFAQLLERVRK